LNDDDNDGCYGDFVVVFVVEESWLWWLKVGEEICYGG
jgi:hypothetical protein